MRKNSLEEEKAKRNEPCPCGSGKKYKKCCLLKQESSIDLKLKRYKETDIQLNEKLMKFAADYLSEEEKEDTFTDFLLLDEFDEIFKDVDVEEDDLLCIEENMKNIYFPWLLYDYWTEQDGATVAEMYLEKRGSKLDEIERNLVNGHIDSFLSYYQVNDVREGAGISLKDVITGDEFFVSDISTSHQVIKWDILYARIIKADQYYILCGNCMVFPPDFKQNIQEFMSDSLEEHKRIAKTLSYKYLQKNFVLASNYLVLILMKRLATKPKLVNFDGEELMFLQAHYEVTNAQKLVSQLNQVKHFEAEEVLKDKNGEIEEAGYNWFGKSKGRRDTVSLGSLQIKKNKMTVLCNSKERLAKVKKILAKNCGDLLKHKATMYKDVESMLKEAKEKPIASKPEVEVPLEVQKEIREKFQSEYQDDWLNSSIPALGGLTPKQASKTKKGKRQLEELLRSFENRQLRAERRVGEEKELPPPVLDIGRIRKELGLL